MQTARENPYSTLFGKLPEEYIVRPVQTEEIYDTFTMQKPTQQIFLITGVRGSGKTVLMTEICRRLKADNDWTVVALKIHSDMTRSLLEKLNSDSTIANLIKVSGIDLSFFGIGVHVAGAAPLTDQDTALQKILEHMKEKNQRLLIAIDDVENTEDMRSLAETFQILVRADLPVFLLMTGLYENISDLQDEKSLTFLYRAPKITLEGLNLGAIAVNYQKNLGLDTETAGRMARLTNGYSFAFQLLGSFLWKYGTDMDKVLPLYKQYLEDYSYEKIWSELSQRDKEVIQAIARTENGKIADILHVLDWPNSRLSPYRKRLMKKGIVKSETYGYLSFTLPLFREFVVEEELY